MATINIPHDDLLSGMHMRGLDSTGNFHTGDLDYTCETETITELFQETLGKVHAIKSKNRQGNRSSQQQRIQSELHALWKQVSLNKIFLDITKNDIRSKFIQLFQTALNDSSFAKSYGKVSNTIKETSAALLS